MIAESNILFFLSLDITVKAEKAKHRLDASEIKMEWRCSQVIQRLKKVKNISLFQSLFHSF